MNSQRTYLRSPSNLDNENAMSNERILNSKIISPKNVLNHAAQMNAYLKTHGTGYSNESNSYIPLSLQSPNSNKALYALSPSPSNKYASVNTKKQERERNRLERERNELISRISQSFIKNKSIKTKIMSRLISNEDKKKNGTRFKQDNINSLNNLTSMNNSLIKKINRLIPVYENNSTPIRPGASMNVSYIQPFSNPVFNTLTNRESESGYGSGTERENPYGEKGEDRPSRRNRNEPRSNNTIKYAALALGPSTNISTAKSSSTVYSKPIAFHVNPKQIQRFPGPRPTKEQQQLLLDNLMKSGNARITSTSGGAKKRTHKHNNKKSKSKSRKYRK